MTGLSSKLATWHLIQKSSPCSPCRLRSHPQAKLHSDFTELHFVGIRFLVVKQCLPNFLRKIRQQGSEILVSNAIGPTKSVSCIFCRHTTLNGFHQSILLLLRPTRLRLKHSNAFCGLCWIPSIFLGKVYQKIQLPDLGCLKATGKLAGLLKVTTDRRNLIHQSHGYQRWPTRTTRTDLQINVAWCAIEKNTFDNSATNLIEIPRSFSGIILNQKYLSQQYKFLSEICYFRNHSDRDIFMTKTLRKGDPVSCQNI